MIKSLKIGSLIAVVLLVLSGCGSALIYNVPNNPVMVKQNTKNDSIYRAIKNAGVGLGWIVTKVKDGEAKATLHLRRHLAVVTIYYSSTQYSIQYSSSNNLNYNANGKTIHSNYNGWIQNLERAIDVQLSTLAE